MIFTRITTKNIEKNKEKLLLWSKGSGVQAKADFQADKFEVNLY